jgi:hypothetical protein
MIVAERNAHIWYDVHVGSLETAHLRTCGNFTGRNSISPSEVCRLVDGRLASFEPHSAP